MDYIQFILKKNKRINHNFKVPIEIFANGTRIYEENKQKNGFFFKS